MEKRAILAIVLSLLVVVVWSLVFAPAPPPIDVPPTPQQGRETSPETPRPSGSSAPQGVSETPAPAPGASPGAVRETIVTVDTGVAQLALSSLGAGVKAVQLHDYRVTLDKEAPPITIAPVPGVSGIPLTAELRLGQRVTSLENLDFVPSTAAVTLSQKQPEGTVTFRGQISPGVTVLRTFQFHHNSYDFTVSTQIEGLSPTGEASLALLWGPGLLQQAEENSGRQGETKAESRGLVRGKIFHEAPEKVGETKTWDGDVTWIALADTYFAVALIPQEPTANAALVRRLREDALEVSLRTPLGGEQFTQTVRVYVGPKKQYILQAVHPSLDRLIDLGFFSPLARPMMQLLLLINAAVHNFGITIILVTILIKIVFWPLTQKSYTSMQAMQKLQPKMQELQVVYKDDKPALNRAMMQLYRDNKVNPMGGCLPMLIQIPFFFAFYNALLYSIELRHAPFICWENKLFWVGRGICDLSVYDPSYVTPLLMGVTMFLQQKMTPTVGDPTQAKIMQFMPLIFLFFFLNAPAGLVIYWLMNNVLSIVQQVYVNRSRRLQATAAETAGSGS
jgi:YidC/Oxa1 family membrane protein insertase